MDDRSLPTGKRALSRRSALGLAAGSVVAAGSAAVLLTAADSGSSAMRRIGQAFVHDHGAAAAGLLLANSFGHGSITVPDDLADRIAGDFRAGRTVLLRGFMLSASEVAACLVAAGVRPA